MSDVDPSYLVTQVLTFYEKIIATLEQEHLKTEIRYDAKIYNIKVFQESEERSHCKNGVNDVYDYSFFVNHYIDYKLIQDINQKEKVNLVEMENGEYSYPFSVYLSSYKNVVLIPNIQKLGMSYHVVQEIINEIFKKMNSSCSLVLKPSFKNPQMTNIIDEIFIKFKMGQISRIIVEYQPGKFPLQEYLAIEKIQPNSKLSQEVNSIFDVPVIQKITTRKNYQLVLDLLSKELKNNSELNQDFHTTYSKFEIELKGKNIWTFNQSKKVDLALIESPVFHNDIVYREWMEDELVVVSRSPLLKVLKKEPERGHFKYF